ncbi:MAG: hypothetical protein U0234_08120 [Sandaracinus sp.]
MTMRLMLVVAVVLVALLAPVRGVAQSLEPARPNYDASIVLHVAAATSAAVGTVGVALGVLGGLGCTYGGGDCATWALVGVGGGFLLSVALALGISASAVHAHTRSLLSATMTALPWLGPTGGGLALEGRFSL